MVSNMPFVPSKQKRSQSRILVGLRRNDPDTVMVGYFAASFFSLTAREIECSSGSIQGGRYTRADCARIWLRTRGGRP
jgi:hypothetical protein